MPLATELSNRISQALLNDQRTSEAVIEVTAQQGVIILSGVVDSEDTRHAAEEIARSQPEVISVINELTIQ